MSTDKWLRHNDPKLEELVVKTGWILITRSGTTGIISSVPAAWNNYAMSEHIIRVVPDSDKINPAYLYAFLKTKFAQDVLSRGKFGSVIDEITPEFIGEIDIWIPQSQHILEEIVKRTEVAQKARETAIEQLMETLVNLDTLLEAVG